ncbi:hypothetical protein AAMO2058_000988800 [Amorphochlora amoebiformis]
MTDHTIDNVLKDINNTAFQYKGKLIDLMKDTGGYNRMDMHEGAAKLNDCVAKFFQKQIEQAEQEKATIQSNIRGLKHDLESTVHQLGLDEVPSVDSENLSLIDQKEAWMKLSKELEAKRETRISELNEAISGLNHWNTQLQGGMDITQPSPENATQFNVMPPADAEARNLSLTHIKYINELSENSKKQYHLRKQWVSSTCAEVKQSLEDLDLKPGCYGYPPKDAVINTEMDRKILEESKSFGVDWATIEALRLRQDELENLNMERQTELKELAGQIIGLWRTLHIKEDYQEEFMAGIAGRGVTVATFDECLSELSRLKEQMAEHIKIQVGKAKDHLKALWDEVGFSSEQRQAFKPYQSEFFTDETLERIRTEVDRVEAIACKMRPILKLINDREGALRDLQNIEIEGKELGDRRFRASKYLLRAEKVRKRVQKILSDKNEKTLQKALKKWREENGQDLIYNGIAYIEVVEAKLKELASRRLRGRRGSRR